VIKSLLDFICGKSIPLSHVVHRGVREDHAPAERVIRQIPLDDGDVVLRVPRFHQEAEIQAGGTTANTDDFDGEPPKPQ
jgi:hypothetical protein